MKDQARLYQITIQGHLDPRWSEWFENLAITPQPDGTTTLSGSIVDQAALYGLIVKLRDMGLILLTVQVQPTGDDETEKTQVAHN